MAYILYDFEHPTKGDYAWNNSVWKARLTLNYQQIPYRTIFIPLTDAEKTAKAVGAAPTRKFPDGRDWYTLPILRFPDGSAVSDSFEIAKRLDRLHPEKPVIPKGDAGLQILAVDWFMDSLDRTAMSIITYAVADWQVGAGKKYVLDRATAFGLPRPPPTGSEELENVWKGVENVWARVARYMNESGAGATSFGCHGEPVFFDFAIIGVLKWWKEVLTSDDWARVEKWQGGRWKKMLENFEAYMMKKD